MKHNPKAFRALSARYFAKAGHHEGMASLLTGDAQQTHIRAAQACSTVGRLYMLEIRPDLSSRTEARSLSVQAELLS